MEQVNLQPYEPEPSLPEKIIGNILKSIVSIFLLVICFFIVALVVSTLAGQQAIEYETFTKDFCISNPTLEQVVYTSNTHLANIVITKYNSSNSSYGGIPDSNWDFDSSTASINISAGALEHTITGLHISAETTYAESQFISVFTVIALSLIISAIMMCFGIIAWKRRKVIL